VSSSIRTGVADRYNLAASPGKVNKFRKALSKKHIDEVDGYKGDFIQGCVQNEVKQEVR